MFPETKAHLFAFYTNDLADASVNTALGTVVDQVISRPNGRYQLPRDMRVTHAYSGTVGNTGARLNVPAYRRLFLPQLDPVSVTALPADNPSIVRMGDTGPTLPESEELAFEQSRTSGAAADAYGLVWASVGRNPVPPGPQFTMLATAAITGAEGTWAAGSLTFNDTLPAGTYAVTGLSVYGTAVLAGRLIFPNANLRPGVLAQAARGEILLPDWRYGNAGCFGYFKSYVVPQLEIFCTGASTAQVAYLDLVQVNAQP